MGFTKGNRRPNNRLQRRLAIKHRLSDLLKNAYEHHVSGNYPEAQQGYEEILYLAPNHPDANHLLGLLALERQDYDLAINLVGIALKQDPENLSYLGSMANIKHLNGEHDNSVTLYQRLIQLYPHCTEAHIALGNVYRDCNQRQLAILQYRRAIGLEPNQADCHFSLGLIYKELQNYEEAEICFQRNLRIDRYHFDAYYQLGLVLCSQKKYEVAIITFEELIELNGNYISAFNKLGDCYEALHQYDMAEKTFLKTLDIDPDNSYAYNKLGILAKHESQYSKAIRYFQQAIEKCSCDFNALQNLGHTYHIMKEYDKALSVYQEAKIFQPQHATLNYYIAALTGKNLEKAPLAYIESLYDEYAKQINNDFSVESEDYPIAKQIIDIITPMSHTLNNKIILDLGCGQGTFGKFYKRNYPNHHIVGIDISTKMLELARKTSSYHELVHKDFMHYLKTQSNIGMIIASDSLSYIGKLNVFLISAYHALSTNGILALSIAASTKKAYMLNKDGRFYHHSDTIETICKQLGFILAHKEETLFANIQPTPTFGYILTFRKT